MDKILHQKTVFDGHLTIQEAQFTNGRETYTRERVIRPGAAAVLVYNTDSQKFILTRQFRYAISTEHPETILEIVAGKLDGKEEPKAAAIRECLEEIGYKIAPENVHPIGSSFASPGYTSELLHLFYAEVRQEDQLNAGGGLKEEQEEITVVEMERNDFLHKVKNMELQDAKSLIAGLWFIAHRL